MTDAKKYAAVFRAAGRGVMARFNPPPTLHGGQVSGPFSGRDYEMAENLSGAFHAIADMFEKMDERGTR